MHRVPPLKLVTWFHADAPDRAGTYSQTLGDAGGTAHYEVYLRCIDVCVASFRRWNAGPALVVLNERARDAIDSARLAFWAGEGVEIAVAENRHQPEVDVHSRWQNQFFLFDVIRAAVEHAADPGAPIVVLDSDCVIRDDLAPLAAAIAEQGRVVATVGDTEDDDINGLTRRDLGRLAAERGFPVDGVPEYLGGEFVAGTAGALSSLLDRVDEVYEWTLQRAAAGLPHPNEEAHMLSLVPPYLAAEVTGNAFVERIWTQPWVLRRFGADVHEVPIWHLPAEKRTGIVRLQRGARRPGSWFRSAARDEWLRRVGAEVGVPRFGALKLAKDGRALAGRVVPVVRRRIGAGRS